MSTGLGRKAFVRRPFTTLLVAIGAAIVLAPAAAAAEQRRPDVTREILKAMPMTAGQSLEIDHSQGNIDIAATSDREVKIRAMVRVSAYSSQVANDFADRIVVEVTSGATATRVRTVYPRDRSRGWLDTLFGRSYPSFAVDYTVLVPQGVLLSVRNRFGDVRVGGIAGKTTIVNSNGRILGRDVSAGARLENSFGSVEVTRALGALTIANSNGAITLVDAAGDVTISDRFGPVSVRNVGGELSVRNSSGAVEVLSARGGASIRNSFGTIRLDDIAGEVVANNANGSIEARRLRGGGRLSTSFGRVAVVESGKGLSVTGENSRVSIEKVNGPVSARTTFGPIEVRDVTGTVDAHGANGAVTIVGVRGPVQARTSFGAVSLRDVVGDLQIDNHNGSIEALSSPGDCRNLRATTTFGAIRVGLAENAGYRVSLRTTFGRITSDLPIAAVGALSSDSVTGTIGRGGCVLDLSNSNGNITISKTLVSQP